MIVEFLPEAETDARHIQAWYEERSVQAAERFQQALEKVLLQLVAFPQAGKAGPFGTRRALLRKFPLLVVYRVHPDRIVVHAVAHASQDSDVWHRRMR